MSNYQKLFTLGTLKEIAENVSKKNFSDFDIDKKYSEDNLLLNTRITINDVPKLKIPDSNELYEFENSKILFDSYRELTRVQATDGRMWSYMALCQFKDYSLKRWPFPNDKEEKAKSILEHWLILNPSAKTISRHAIASLWWGAYITYDESKEDPYELTREFFSRQEYKRHLLERSIVRYTPMVHAILEHVLENEQLFSQSWEDKLRFVMRKLNLYSSYKVFSSCTKAQIKEILVELKYETEHNFRNI